MTSHNCNYTARKNAFICEKYFGASQSQRTAPIRAATVRERRKMLPANRSHSNELRPTQIQLHRTQNALIEHMMPSREILTHNHDAVRNRLNFRVPCTSPSPADLVSVFSALPLRPLRLRVEDKACLLPASAASGSVVRNHPQTALTLKSPSHPNSTTPRAKNPHSDLVPVVIESLIEHVKRSLTVARKVHRLQRCTREVGQLPRNRPIIRPLV
jgi:hypothetical protein